MANRFFTAFKRSNAAAEAIMGEPWYFNGAEWPAVALDDLTTQSERMPGGKYRDSSIALHVRKAVVTESGVIESSIIEARQPWPPLTTRARFRVNEIRDVGDDTLELVCSSPQIKAPRG